MSHSLPQRVRVVEVGPRDGLQNEKRVVPAVHKIAFVDRLTAAGFEHIEVTSFVSPRWVPQLADAADVFAGITPRAGVTYSALVPNLFGMDRAVAAGARYVAVFTAASETFNQHNIHASIDESLQRFEPVARRARDEGLSVRGYVSTCFGCPYEGGVAPEAVARVAGALWDLGVVEVSLGDTIGVGHPGSMWDVLEAVSRRVPLDKVAVHLHDTFGRALANVLAALESGVSIIDSSAGGLGGCPYAPSASGNLATEDLVAMLDAMGIETGIDLGALADASLAMEQELGRVLPSRYLSTVRGQRALLAP